MMGSISRTKRTRGVLASSTVTANFADCPATVIVISAAPFAFAAIVALEAIVMFVEELFSSAREVRSTNFPLSVWPRMSRWRSSRASRSVSDAGSTSRARIVGKGGVGKFVDEPAGVALQIESGASKAPSKKIVCFIRLSKTKRTRTVVHAFGVMRVTLRFAVNRRKHFVPLIQTRGTLFAFASKTSGACRMQREGRNETNFDRACRSFARCGLQSKPRHERSPRSGGRPVTAQRIQQRRQDKQRHRPIAQRLGRSAARK